MRHCTAMWSVGIGAVVGASLGSIGASPVSAAEPDTVSIQKFRIDDQGRAIMTIDYSCAERPELERLVVRGGVQENKEKLDPDRTGSGAADARCDGERHTVVLDVYAGGGRKFTPNGHGEAVAVLTTWDARIVLRGPVMKY